MALGKGSAIVSIGDAIAGATATCVLYVDSNGAIAQSSSTGLFWDATNKKLAIGSALGTASKLSVGGNPSSLTNYCLGVSYAPTFTSGTAGGIVMQSVSTPASNMSGANYSLFFESGTASGQANNWTATPVGLVGATGNLVHRGTGVVTGAAMFLTGVPTVSQSATTGAITTVYGFYIQKMKQAGVGTGYGMYQADSADINYFAGSVGIGQVTPNAASMLDIVSTTRGFLPPRMTGTQRDNIISPVAGLVIYNTSTNKLNVFTTVWEAVTSA